MTPFVTQNLIWVASQVTAVLSVLISLTSKIFTKSKSAPVLSNGVPNLSHRGKSRLLPQVIDLHCGGHIKPIAPVQTFDTNELAKVETTVRKTEVIGKVVVRAAQRPESLRQISIAPEIEFREDVSYLLVGGLGGLGQAISTCMIERGARHFIYLSRTAGDSEEYADFFCELESQGCSVQAFSGDVANIDDVKHVVREAKYRISGVLHMAMVLQDHPFLEMPYNSWNTAIRPKVDGTWNLHNALLHQNLDFFVIFGSISGSFGIAHQANYAAANTFQDSFVQYRHSNGLPASVLNIGAMADVGYVSQNQSVQDYFRAAGMPFLSEGDLFEALHLSIQQQLPINSQAARGDVKLGFTCTSQLALGIRATKLMDDPSNRVLWKHDRRVDIYRNIEASRIESGEGQGMGGEEGVLTTLMKEVRASPSVLSKQETLETLTHEIGINVYSFMLLPPEDLDITKSMMALGVDSLVTIEIRNWLSRTLEVETSTLEILNGGTIEVLGRIAVQRLREKYEKVNGEI
ncbi:putative secondary metabolism biosynthetic enzyme [Arachnomyces sp. PD_36]|nr:putative secondary metabolism biosynthetic enzyme [Arachnomyces sp. PD_36]